eukprot:1160741-Pelagomonas_calceolata.AAC.9
MMTIKVSKARRYLTARDTVDPEMRCTSEDVVLHAFLKGGTTSTMDEKSLVGLHKKHGAILTNRSKLPMQALRGAIVRSTSTSMHNFDCKRSESSRWPHQISHQSATKLFQQHRLSNSKLIWQDGRAMSLATSFAYSAAAPTAFIQQQQAWLAGGQGYLAGHIH